MGIVSITGKGTVPTANSSGIVKNFMSVVFNSIGENGTSLLVRRSHCRSQGGFLQLFSQRFYRVRMLLWRQRGREVRAPHLKSVGRGFNFRSDHLAGVVSL